jgi:hypothetical protein
MFFAQTSKSRLGGEEAADGLEEPADEGLSIALKAEGPKIPLLRCGGSSWMALLCGLQLSLLQLLTTANVCDTPLQFPHLSCRGTIGL